MFLISILPLRATSKDVAMLLFRNSCFRNLNNLNYRICKSKLCQISVILISVWLVLELLFVVLGLRKFKFLAFPTALAVERCVCDPSIRALTCGRSGQNDLVMDSEPRKCVLLTSQCSGSTWLYRTLDSIPSVHFSGELLIKYSRNRTLYETVEWPTYVKHLNEALSSPKTKENVELIGFKLMYDQLPTRFYGQFVAWLEENNITLLHLRRCAILAYSSHVQKVRRGGLTHVTDEHELKLAQSKTQLLNFEDWFTNATKALEDRQMKVARYLQVFASRVPVLEIKYEDLDGPFQQLWFGAVLTFLQMHPCITDNKLRLNAEPTMKVGSRTCGSRIRGLDLNVIEELQSSAQCAALKISSGETLSITEAELFLPKVDLRTGRKIQTRSIKSDEEARLR